MSMRKSKIDLYLKFTIGTCIRHLLIKPPGNLFNQKHMSNGRHNFLYSPIRLFQSQRFWYNELAP